MSDEDWQRYADELERCRILGTEVPAPYPSPSSVTTGNDAKYYAERARVLAAVGMNRAVAFLREEALAALAGRAALTGSWGRWMALAVLEKFGVFRPENVTTGSLTVGLMEEGILKMDRGKINDIVEANRARRHAEATSCPTCPGGICDWSCF